MAKMINRTDAGSLIPEPVAREIMSGVRKSSVAMSLMRRLPNMTSGTQRQPVLSMLPQADFVNGDSGMKTTTNAAWGSKQLVAGEIAVIVPVPQAVIDDANYDIWGETKPLIAEAMARVFDNQVFSARNAKAPVEWPEPIILAAQAAGHTVEIGENKDIAEDVSKTIALLEELEYDPTGIASQISLRGKLRDLRASDGTPIYQQIASGQPSTVYSLPTHFVGAGTWDKSKATAIVGAWNNAVYSIRQDLSFQIFDTGVISDDDGKVVYNLLQQDMVAMRAVMRLAWQVSNPIDIDRPAGAYPFAVLKPSANP